MRPVAILVVFLLFVVASTLASQQPQDTDDTKDEANVDPKQLEYAKGSVCGYCDYCKFCKLCDDDCPCEASATKPNCHMCKYCKYCYLCSGVCDTICQPGGILDKVSGAIVNALPSYDKEEVDQDIHSVKSWLDKKDEL